MNIKEQIIEEFVKLCKRDDIKYEFKNLMRPLIGMILQEFYPYIFLSLLFVIIGFLLVLAIFILLLRKKSILSI
jgi:hypothetical protein